MNDDNSQSTIGEINSSLSLAAKRQHGLFKMISFLENCSTSQECSLLEQNCPFWIRTIFQILENHPVSLHAKLSHYAFYLIIQNSKSLSSDLQRHISTSLIEKAIHLIISSNDVLAKNSLLCLNELISCYKASCSQFKNKIENYIFNKLESESDEVIKWAGVCYAKLPYLHKNTNNNNNTTDMWYLYFKSMLQNVNTLLNDLFEDYNQQTTVEQQTNLNESLNETLINKNEQKTDIRQFTKLSKDSENLEFYYKKSLKRFKSCMNSLGSLLEPSNEKVVIKVRHLELINLLKRIYLFDFKKLSHNCRMNDESKYLSNCMSQILMSTFEFSEKFFTILNTNLIPNSNVINNILVNCGHSLIDYISNTNEMRPLFTSYYSCLNIWMTSLGYNSAFHLNTFSIIENLLIKIKPVEKNILCIEKNDNNKVKNKQARESASFGQEKYALNSQQILVQSKFIKSALECLRTYLRNFSFNLSYNQYEKIHSTIIDIILCVQYNCNIRRPYDHNETRQYLYETLFDLCFTKNTKLTPPISVSIGLFKNALNDNSKQIQLMSKNCLNFFKSFTYPLQPTYTKEFTIETNTKMEETTNTTTTILMSNLALPITTNGPISVNKPTNSNIDESKPNEIDQFITKQQQNGYTIEEEDNYDVVKNSLSLNGQSNKRKIDYEDEDDDEEMNEDDQDEDEIEYKPKNIAKKFQSNGSYQNRNNIKVLNGRDINENSNGDDDDVDEEEEEENEEEEEEEEGENEDEEVISLDEEVEDVENDEELEDDVEQNDEEDEQDDGEEEEVEQTEEIEQEVVCEQLVIEHVQNQNELLAKVESQEDKTNSETNTELAHEAKSIIKETCGEYDDDDDDHDDEAEEDDVESQTKSIDSSKINENEDKNDNQEEISMANLETVRMEEVIENSVEQEILQKEEQNFEKAEVIESNTELDEENKPSENAETAGVDSEGFDEDKFKQMCSSLNVNAIAENNNNNN